MPSLEDLLKLHTAAARLTCDLSDLYVANSNVLPDIDADALYAAVLASSKAAHEMYELINRNYGGSTK